MASTLQQRRTSSAVLFTPPPFPKLIRLAPKMAKAFPDDMAAMQEALDDWWRKTKVSIQVSIDGGGK